MKEKRKEIKATKATDSKYFMLRNSLYFFSATTLLWVSLEGPRAPTQPFRPLSD